MMASQAQPKDILEYTTTAGLSVRRESVAVDAETYRTSIPRRLDQCRGVFLTSGMEVPGRYSRFDLGFSDPPLMLEGRGRHFTITTLNARGAPLLAVAADALEGAGFSLVRDDHSASGDVAAAQAEQDESRRTRRSSLFTVIRTLVEAFGSPEDSYLGLYGAFAYDLVFGLEDLQQKLERPDDQRDIVLYIPDRIFRADYARETAELFTYDFEYGELSSEGIERTNPSSTYRTEGRQAFADHQPGDYQEIVEKARQAFARGDLFETVPGQLWGHACPRQPSEVFETLCAANPAPYGGLLNLGNGEFLVSASPEMFVRTKGKRVETCPISGTIARGRDSIEDARNIQALLNSTKDEYELNMCTDVDRNDKARVCVPGSVKVIGRRQVELYSRVIHTVDHVEGQLRDDMDSLDAFLTHAWAVTVTGAPKLWAMQFIEDNERTPRRWYGGAIGGVTFDGDINTGLTIRTTRMQDGVAEVRAGATLLFDSDPDAEARECDLKASALISAINAEGPPSFPNGAEPVPVRPFLADMLLIDCEDSFVHMLADYFRQAGARVDVVRHGMAREALAAKRYDIVTLSPGPGRPDDFALNGLIDEILGKGLPIFGVCLGLQALGEYFGASLDQLGEPMHGRPSVIKTKAGLLFDGQDEELTIGRYHSLYIDPASVPDCLTVTARSEDGVPQAIEHTHLPIAAVQFHPESILSAQGDTGLKMVERALSLAQKALAT